MTKKIQGQKGGSSSSRTPTEQSDDLQSVAKAKILIALGEGEFAGGLTAKDIYLDGTPLENPDGSKNFSGVTWEFRPGTQAQRYIQGIPGTENEISVGTEISSETAWTHTFTNTQLSAVRLRLKWPSLMKQEDDGDVVGNTVKYAIDLQTDGGTWQTVLDTAVTGKTTSGYERSHRIDLPQAGSTWTLRLRKVTPDANSVKTGDAMSLQSYTEVIDAKLRYPHTALLYIEFDSSQFNGSIPQIACEPKMRVIRVPDNYNPETREYTGVWTGAFKWAWTDNPAWIFYDLVVSERFGTGDRLTAENIDKWTLYQVAQYCDAPVPDGKGGNGTEPRYICNVYVQERNDAWTVLRDFVAIFRGMTCWSGNQIVTLADMPRDVDYSYNRANVINGQFKYSSSTTKSRYTSALVSWSDPDNGYADATEPVFEPELVSRYKGFNQLEVTAIGCTRQSEANRKGRWGILTNNKDRVVSFQVGLDGNIPQPGYIIAVADEKLSGKVNGGRISGVNGRAVTLDREPEAVAGDRLILNLPSGKAQSRTIEAVNGSAVTVTTAYSETPEAESAWIVESDELYAQQYRVVSVTDNNNGTFDITAAAHDPDKYSRIDTGAIIDSRPVSVVPPGSQAAPGDIVIGSYSVVNQGISVETLRVSWSDAASAVAYEAQWRRNEGNWVNVPRSATTSFEVPGIYAGRYLVRVRAINAAEVSSGWGYSQETMLSGKAGQPAAPLALTTTSLLHGVQLNWGYPAGSSDTLKTTLEYSPNQDGAGAMTLSEVAYPGTTYQQTGLRIGALFWYRARITDRSGNESPWTAWVQGMASDDISAYYEKLTDGMKGTEAWQETQRDIAETHTSVTETAETIRGEVAQQVSDINLSISDNISAVKQSIADTEESINAGVDKKIDEVNTAFAAGDDTLSNALKASENALKQTLAQSESRQDKAVKQEKADRIADVSAKAAQAADQLLNEKNEREAAIESTQKIIQDASESLATQLAQISAGTGEQFDSIKIWYFDGAGAEGWTSNKPAVLSSDGWLKPGNGTDSYLISPSGLAIAGASYRFLKMRIRKVGTPVWEGAIRWITQSGKNFNDTSMAVVDEPEYNAQGIATLTVSDIGWNGGNVDTIRLDLTTSCDDKNYIEVDWIAVGRPTPGASTAALRDESTARAAGDAAEAGRRTTLAAQIRGASESSRLEDLRSGLLYEERNARITADRAEVTARESLETQFSENRASVAEEQSSLSTAQSAQASKLSGLETRLGKKADASAVQSLTQKVEQQGATLTSQSDTLSSLTNRLGKTESGVAANSNAISGLQSGVSEQDKTLTSQSQAITKLQNDLTTTKANVSTRAEQAALTALTGRVEKTESGLTAANSNIVSLTAGLSAGRAAGDDYIPNPGFDPAYDRMGYDVVAATTAGVPANCPFANVARLAVRDHVPKMNNIAVTPGDVFEMSALVACGGGQADFNLFIAGATSATSGVKARLSGGNTKATAAWTRATWRFTVPSDTNFMRPFLQVNQSSPFGTVWYAADWHLRNVTAANRAQNAADATAKAVDSLTTKVSQQGDTLSSLGSRTTSLENGLKTTNADVSKKADGSAVQALQNTVTQQGKDITAANSAITKLTGDLSTTNTNVSKKADATALQTLQNTVTQQGNTLASQGQSITSLQGSLSSANTEIAKKADASAVNTLTNRVTQAENKLDSQSQSITSLNNSIAAVQQDADAAKAMPTNMLANNSFERGFDSWRNNGWTTLAAQNPKSGKFIIQATTASGNGTECNQDVSMSAGRTYRVGAWVRKSGDFAASNPDNTKISIRNSSGPVKDLFLAGSDVGTSWTKVSTDYKPTSDVTLTVSLRTSLSAGYLYIDDAFCIDVTDEVANSVNAAAISALTTRVTNDEGKITSQGQSITSLQNSLGNKSDVGAVNSLTTRVTQAEGKIESAATSLTSLNSTVGNLSSTVQTQGQTLADTNGKLNSMYSIKVETNNGKKVGAGIVLGSDGDTSDMILYADRFSLFNRNSKASVPVMIAEGNELYIDSARIKNGSIDNAKIGDFICSSNYNWADGSTGWLISKDGACLFNNGRFRGTVYADGGEFNNVTIRENCNVLGTVQAAKIVGDVGAYGINIAQHRSRSIPKATWVWYDLMVVDRQPFAQRVQLVGALRQDDKINISGSGDFSAEPGYCIMMRAAGATSGGGAMTCAISIDGILYAQEGDAMKVQSMDFVVPAGTGQTVVRYGYYLDRNGSMKGAILSRFHAFASRNSNIVRGASSD